VIDYAGGTPSANELRALRDEGHNVVLRNGRTLPGRLVMLRPDVLRFHNNESGRTEEYRVGDISRIYLNTDRARSVFNVQDAEANRSVFTPGQERWGGRRTGEVTVAGNTQWVDTGLDVVEGDRLTFQATGQIRLSDDRTAVAGAAGVSAARSPNHPIPAVGAGALIGRINDGQPFFIGGGRAVVSMPASGRLQLGVNDDNVTDNAGTFRVRITR
jgi:hypothetical protein